VSVVAIDETRAALDAVRVGEATAAARRVRSDLERAVRYGIPLAELRGVDEYLAERASRSSVLRALAVVDQDGRRLYHAGMEGGPTDQLLAKLPPATPKDGDATQSLATDSMIVLRVPLRGSAAAVVVGIEAGATDDAFMKDVLGMWPFWLGCLLLAIAWANIAVREGIIEPTGRLASAMAAATAGLFDTLLVRRARDPIGQCLLAFNRVVAGLHARRQSFAAHADEVREAVFEAEVASAAERLREETLASLGEGMALLPRKVDDPRASDADWYATLTGAGATLSTAQAAAMLPSWEPALLFGAIGAAAGAAAGWRFGHRRWIELTAALVLLVTALVALGASTRPDIVALCLALVSGTVAGYAGGVAFERRRAARLADGASGSRWVVFAGVAAGASMAWCLAGDTAVLGATAVAMAVIASGTAIVAPHRR
jgi:hypothetical protein